MLFSEETKAAIESLLFITNEPLALEQLAQLTDIELDEAAELVTELCEEYDRQSHGIFIKEAAGGYMMATKTTCGSYVEKLYKPHLQNLSSAGLETLAIIAYKQPITRGEIELLRGVKVDKIMQNLTTKQLIEEQGRKDAPGRPILYGTTKQFLQYFGLNSLSDLPQAEDLPQNFSTEELLLADEEE